MKSIVILSTLAVSSIIFSCSDDDDDKTKKLKVDEQSSMIKWTGSGPAAQNEGSFDVTGENITLQNGKLATGTFIIPIASIDNFNLPDQVKPQLLDHLKSPDFFNLLLYPDAKLVMTSIKPFSGSGLSTVEGANYLITGDFIMIGNTHEISFPAKITITNNNRLEAVATLVLDRTKWGMTYAADPALGEHHIYPNVDLSLKLVATAP